MKLNDNFIKRDFPFEFHIDSSSSSYTARGDWNPVDYRSNFINERGEVYDGPLHGFNFICPCKCKRDNTHPNNRAENEKHIVYPFNNYTDYIFEDGWNPECPIHKDSEFSNPKTKDEMFGNTMEADYEREMANLRSSHKILDFGSILKQINKDYSLWVGSGIIFLLVIFIILMLIYC